MESPWDIRWESFIIDTREWRVCRAEDRQIVRVKNRSGKSGRILSVPAVRILVLMFRNKNRRISASDVDLLKDYSEDQRNTRFVDYVSQLRRGLNPEFDRDFILARRSVSQAKATAYEFRGVTSLDENWHSPFPQIKAKVLPLIDENMVLELGAEMGLEGTALLSRTLEWKAQEDYHRVERLKAAQLKIRREKRHTGLLKDYYPDDDLSAAGLVRYRLEIDGSEITTNIAVPVSSVGMRVSLKEDQDRFHFSKVCSFLIPKPSLDDLARFIASAWARNVVAKNDPIYCLQSFSPENLSSSMTFSLAKYFDHRLGYGRLWTELCDALIETDFEPDRVMADKSNKLRLREKLLPTARQIINCSARPCPGGVNVVVALRRVDEDHDDFVFPIEQRSHHVETAQGEESIIPSGFHAVLAERDAAKAVSPAHSVFREVAEELFGRQEFVSHAGQVEYELFPASFPPLHWFKTHPTQFQHEVVSFGFDLIDGSYQFGILLLIHNPDYWEQFKSLAFTNYEFKSTGKSAVVISTRNTDSLTQIFTNPLFADTSFIALVEALMRLKELEPERVSLPELTPIRA